MDKAKETIEFLEYIKQEELKFKEISEKRAKEKRVATHLDLYYFGILKRAVFQSRAFRSMIDQKNEIVAGSLLRLQLDTVLRSYAPYWSINAESFAELVFKGNQIDKIKSFENKLMKDFYLREKLISKNPWIFEVYKQSSGYIHFSNRHINSAIETKEVESGNPTVLIEVIGNPLEITAFREFIKAFSHINRMIAITTENAYEKVAEKIEPFI